MSALPLPGLQIDSPLVTPSAQNFLPPKWPPPRDFPVTIDADGNVVSRFGDTSWNLGPWNGRSLQLNFGDGPSSRSAQVISTENADIFRYVTAWWLWGPNAVRSARTLEGRHGLMKVVFVTCSDAGIKATDLSRFPKVIESLASRLTSTRPDAVLAYLNDLWLVRNDLGFTILDTEGLKQLSALIPQRESTQTAYIPPRIWTYQVNRLSECINDYVAHRESIEACYRFCLDAYAANAGGSLVAAYTGLSNGQLPFHPNNLEMVNKGYRKFYGAFRLTAKRFGIDELLDRWVNASPQAGVKALSSYLTLINYVGLAHVLNFSLQRVGEGSVLRANCHSVERDFCGEEIHTVGGITTKTIKDDDARWIVAPSVQRTIEAMASVAQVRMLAWAEYPGRKPTDADIANPILQAWAYEPWSANDPKYQLKKTPAYSQLQVMWPKLFDLEQLRITEADHILAMRMTFGLNPERFKVGMVWPLAWHQLRRTGAVNMLATGLVTDSSLQYQLKHATRAMSRYYGQNYLRLQSQLDDEARGLYLREMYRSLAREFEKLTSDRFVSPHGEKRKAQILESVTQKDHDKLVADGSAGRISYKETFLGGCVKLGTPCPLGGVSNITGCMGYGLELACSDVLLDREKRPMIVKLKDLLLDRRDRAEDGSLLRDAMQAQLESAERALHVIDSV